MNTAENVKPANKTGQIIYDMPEEEYHALPRLSSSGIKKLLVSSQTFWKWSWFNEDKEEKETNTLNVGKAFHKRILEGKEAFDAAYAVKPPCDRRTKEGKAIYAQFKADYPDAKEVEKEVKDYIESAAHRILHKPELAKFFTNGAPEVTILWNDPETNVPMKSRIDFMSHKHKFFVDLKTFSNSNNYDLKHVVTSAISKYHYYTQAAMYHEALEQVGIFDQDMYFVFQESGMNNNTVPVRFGKESLLAEKGRMEIRRGIKKFQEMYNKYGKDEWFDDIEELDLIDEDFPLYVFD